MRRGVSGAVMLTMGFGLVHAVNVHHVQGQWKLFWGIVALTLILPGVWLFVGWLFPPDRGKE